MSPAVAYFDASNEATLRYRVRASQPVDLRIQVVDRATGGVIRGWLHRGVRSGETRREHWSGLDTGGDPPAGGRYKFVLRVRGAVRAAAVAKFRFHDHVFPIPGAHSYREGDGEFGALRPGRIHEGKDVWAGCGQEVIAARGGWVQRVGYHGRLYGNFVVVDGRRTQTDYFYVHLLRTAAPREGDRVRTGELLGWSVRRATRNRSVACCTSRCGRRGSATAHPRTPNPSCAPGTPGASPNRSLEARRPSGGSNLPHFTETTRITLPRCPEVVQTPRACYKLWADGPRIEVRRFPQRPRRLHPRALLFLLLAI